MHRTNLEKAKSLLQTADHTLVLCDAQIVITDKRRGIRPLLDLIEGQLDCRDCSVADKVVGKAAAYLYCILQIKCLYARTISQPALDILSTAGIFVEYDQLVPAIRNRTNDGFCPMEQAVWNIDDPDSALAAIYHALSQLN